MAISYLIDLIDIFSIYGGERGIRTLDRVLAYTPLAGVRLQPLGQLSVGGCAQRERATAQARHHNTITVESKL